MSRRKYVYKIMCGKDGVIQVTTYTMVAKYAAIRAPRTFQEQCDSGRWDSVELVKQEPLGPIQTLQYWEKD